VVRFALHFHFDPDGVPNEYRAGEAEAVISIGHRNLVDRTRGQPYGNAEDQRAVRDPFLKGLRPAPFFIHVMREEITGLPGMNNNIRFRNSATGSLPGMTDLELFVILIHPHNC
jgi:hypothetical protein